MFDKKGVRMKKIIVRIFFDGTYVASVKGDTEDEAKRRAYNWFACAVDNVASYEYFFRESRTGNLQFRVNGY